MMFSVVSKYKAPLIRALPSLSNEGAEALLPKYLSSKASKELAALVADVAAEVAELDAFVAEVAALVALVAAALAELLALVAEVAAAVAELEALVA
jgi:methyl-accepting chemotaxis protein